MPVWINRTIEAWLLPPGLLIALCLAGLWLLRSRPRLGTRLIAASAVLLYAFSTPLVSKGLMAMVQTYPPLPPERLGDRDAQAIVVLAAGRNSDAAEYGPGDAVSRMTLERVRYGAFIHERTGLPILVSGGRPMGDDMAPLAHLMAHTLKDDFHADPVWVEDRSHTTYENALYSTQQLKERGIERVFLVSQAWHMPRAVPLFRDMGLQVIPAPTGFENVDWDDGILLVMPSAVDLRDSRYALHELLGRIWYWVRY